MSGSGSRRAPSSSRPASSRLALPRLWVIALVAVALVAAAAVVVVVRLDRNPCADDRLVDAAGPLLDPSAMAAQPDPRLDRLAAAVGAMGGPFGAVRAGVGFDYNQWLHLYGLSDGVLAFTKNNAPVTLLDPGTLRPRWSLRPASNRIAWDASSQQFLLLDLAAHKPTRVSAYRLSDGHRAWCTDLPERQSAGDPVSTTFLGDGAVLVALPAKGGVSGGIRVTRLAADHGTPVWQRDVVGADRADFLGSLSDQVAVVGGSEEYRLAQPDPQGRAGPVVTAFDVSDGNPEWSFDAAPGEVVHVVGISAGVVVVVARSAQGTRLLGLSASGSVQWSRVPASVGYEATLRGTVVVMKSLAGLDGYDVATGRLLWHQAIPTDRTYFPYGFTLDQMPSLDADHVLVPTTTALQVLDVRDGTQVGYPLPTDGLSTTFWPYQLLVTDGLLGVITNTGAVVATRAAPAVGGTG